MNPKEILELWVEADRLYQAKEYKQAVTPYRRLAADNPFDGELWRKLAHCEAEVGQPQQAVEAIERALSLGCKFPARVYYEMARLHAGLNNKEASLDWLERSLAARWEDRPGIADEEVFQPYYDDPHFRQLAGLPAEPEPDRDTRWRLDLNHLVEEAQRLHIGLERPAFSDQFLDLAGELRNHIPYLSDEEIVVELQRLIARLGDGHSWLRPMPTDKIGLTMLPLDLYLFSDGLFIIAGTGDAEQWIGSRVLGFGRRSTDEVAAAIAAYVSADNVMDIKRNTPALLTMPAFLQALRVTDHPHTARLTLQDRQGQTHEVMFTGGPLRIPQKLGPSPLTDQPVPLYLRNLQANYWLHELPDVAAVYVQYNKVRDLAEQPLEQFAAHLLEMIQATEARNLIVDVRFNNGGNNFLNWPLVRVLVYFNMAAAGRRLFILTGRHTFSAAQNFVNWVERTTEAIFVGEPTGSRPNFIGETTQVILPYSRIRASISSRLHYDSFWGDERLWIAPQIPIELNSQDYFAHRDPVLEAVLNIIG
jgi:tetratricopeptide (TPR) repeat protein